MRSKSAKNVYNGLLIALNLISIALQCSIHSKLAADFVWERFNMDIIQKIKMESDDEERIVYQQQNDLFAHGFSIMEEIRRQGKLCDVTLKVGWFCLNVEATL